MAVKLRASKVQPLAATTPTYLDYEGLVELVSKLKATYVTQLSLDGYLTISEAASTYQPIGDYALNSTIESLQSDILKQWATHCEDGEILQYTSSDNRLVLTSRGFSNEWGTRLESSYTTAVYVRTICGEHIFGSTTDIDVASLIGLSNYALKTDIPTNVSAFTNDAGYITAADVVEPDLSGYVTTSSLATTLADYAKTSDLPTLSSLGGVGSVSASGTSPLSLSASKSGTTVTITGSVDLSSYVTNSSLTSTLADYAKSSDIPTLSSLSGIGTVNASGTSPLTLSASKSGTTVTISGSVDLSAYATTSTLTGDYYTKTQVDSLLSDATGGAVTTVNASGTSPLTLSASKSGTTVSITGSVDLSAYATTSSLSNYVTSSSLTSTLADYAKASDIPTLSSLGGIGTVTASGTSPLTLSASKSGTSVTISGSVDLSSYATQSWVQEQIADAVTGGTVDLSAYLTKSEAASTYQPIGNYTTSSDFKTINGNSIIGSGDITISGGGGDVDLSNYATKSYVDSALDDYLELRDFYTYQSAVELGFNELGHSSLSTSGNTILRLTTSYPTGDDLSSFSENTSDVTFKTINGESIFGSGNISVTGGDSGSSGSGIQSISALGTAPLTLVAEQSGTSVEITGSVADATTATAGVVKPYNVLSGTPLINSFSTTTGRYYGVETDKNNYLVVNVPWTDTTYNIDDYLPKTVLPFVDDVSLASWTEQEGICLHVKWKNWDGTVYIESEEDRAIPFKTINGQSVIGFGDITISGGGTVDLSDYSTTDEITEVLLRIATDGGLSQRSDGVTLRLTQYYPRIFGSTYTGVNSDVTFKTVGGESIFGSGNVDLSGYAKVEDVMESFIEIAESNMLSQNRDGVTLRLTSYYPKILGDANGSYGSDVTFKTVAGESIFGSGDVALDDYADKATTLSMMQSMMGGLEYVKGSDHSLHINYSLPTAWGTVSHGSSDYVSIHWATLNGLCLFGTDDNYSIEDLGGVSSDTIATADELGLVRPWYNSTFSGSNAENTLGRLMNAQTTTSDRYYGVEALNGRLYVNVPWEGSNVDLSDYATQAWVQEYVTDVVTGGTVDLTAYATKSEVVSLAKNQYSCFWATSTTSSARTTIGFDFWLPDGTGITDGDENQRFALYFANINGNSIVSTSSSGVSNLTISDLGGLASGDLKTVAGESLIGSGDIDPTPWAAKIDGIDEVPGYLTSYIGNTAFNGAASGVIYSSQRICPYVISGSTATVYANWNSSESLKYNTATGLDGTARMDLVFVYDDAAYVYNGFSLNGIGKSTSDLADLQRMRYLYPSATLLGMLDTWFTNIGKYGPSKDDFVYAKIMDYDPDSGTCRIRFGVKDSEEQTYIIRSDVPYVNYPPVDSVVSSTTPTSGNDWIAYFDLILPYNGSNFVLLNYLYIVEWFAD